MSLLEGLALNATGSFFNNVLPLKAGLAFRILYLKSRFGLSPVSFTPQFISLSVLTLSFSSFFGLIGLIKLNFLGYKPPLALLLYFALAAFASLAALFAGGRLVSRLFMSKRPFLDSWNSLARSPYLQRRLALNQAAYFLSWALLNWLTLIAFNVHLSWPALFFFAAVQIHATLINLTPGGLGLVEIVSAFVGQSLGAAPVQILSAQLLFRVVTVSLLSLTSLWGWSHLKRLQGTFLLFRS
jgi:uncharacterized membrane protein YbhN (UPF0104 family)